MTRTPSDILSDHTAWRTDPSSGRRLVWGDLAPSERAALSRADLIDAYLVDADLRDADFSGACLIVAKLISADLSDACLVDADLYGARLRGADLRDADLRGVDLRRGDLRDACLFDAYLIGANLRGANLRGAKLIGAKLRGAKGLPRLHDDPQALRLAVAAHIEAHPELHDQGEWGDGSADPECDTPCCVAGTACHLGGGTHGYSVPTAATLMLHVDGKPMPSFSSIATREEILEALRA